MSTQVIDILGGSGLGKSTTAAGLFYYMKLKGINCEQVTEFVKKLAWEGKRITPLDQLYTMGQQTQSEALLYGKVDYIVTDSPILLSAMYDSFYNKRTAIVDTVLDFIKVSEIKHHYYLLERHKEFDPRGRFETAAQAKEIDGFIKEKMVQWEIPYTLLTCKDEDRVATIMKDLSL